MSQQADGTIYINTAISTDGFKAGGKEVEAAARRMASTVSGIGDSAKLALQKQTDAFVKQNQAYAQQEQKIESLKRKLEELSNQKVATDEFKEIGKQIDFDTAKLHRLEKAQETFLAEGKSTNSSVYKRRQMQIEELINSIRYAKGEQDELLSSGGAYKSVDTSGVEQKLFTEEQRLQQMNNSLGTSYEALKAKVQSYTDESSNLVGIKGKAINCFKSFSSAAKSAAKAIGSKLLSAAKNAVKTIGSKLVSGLKKAGSAMLGLHKNSQKSNNSLGSNLKTMLKYTLGIRSLFVLFNKLRNALKEEFKNLAQYDSRTNSSISSLKSALTQLKNSFATAFAPILNVVAPILKTFINMVSRAVTYVGMLIAALVGQDSFVRAKEVQEDYAASIKDTSNQYKKAEKAQNRYLSGLDEVRRYEEPDNNSSDSGSGSGYSAPTPGEMFETVKIESSLKSLADKIKEAWAKADFTEIGTLLGKRLRDALDKIQWEKVHNAAQKVGKSLATLINGAVEVAGLDKTIGATVGNFLNTGILGAESFVKKLRFKSIGKFIANAMNSAVKTIKWKSIGNLIASSLNGVFDLAATWSRKFDFSRLGSSIKTTIDTALKGIKWEKAVTAVENIANGIADGLNELITPGTFGLIGSTLAEVINTIISGAHTLIGSIDWKQWGLAIATGINDFVANTDWGSIIPALSDAAIGILETLTEAIENINWSEIGYCVADMIKSIDWVGVLKGAAELAVSAFTGLLDFGSALLGGFNMSEWDVFNREISKTHAELEKTNRELKTRIEKASEWKDAGDEYSYAEELADKYFDLAEKESLSNEEKDQMRGLASELVRTIPQLEEYYNTETGLIDTTRGSVDSLIESLKTKARTEAAQDALKEYYAIQLEAKKSLDESTETLEALNKQLESQQAEYNQLGGEIRTLSQDYEANSMALEDKRKGYYNLQNEINKTKTLIAAEEEQVKTSTKQYNDAGQEIDNVTGYLGAMSRGTDTATGSFVKSIVQTGLMALGLGSVQTGSEGAEGGIGSLDEAIGKFIDNIAGYAKTALEKGKETGANYPEGMKEGIEDNKGLVSDAGEDMVDDLDGSVEKRLDINSPSGVAEGFGLNYVQGFANGIANNISLVIRAITKLLTDAKNLFLSESERFKTFGTDYVRQIACGIDKSSSLVSDAVQRIRNSMINAMNGLNNSMSNAGKNAATSFANGLKSVHIPTPHIRFTTSTSQVGGSVTTSSSSSVNWYKSGGFFTSPAIVGVGDAPGGEAVLPIKNTSVMSRLANGIVSNLSAKTLSKTPLMATGTIIPPAAAVESRITSNLRNTVADLNDAIRRINAPAQQNKGQNSTYHFTGQINRRVLFEEIIDEAKLRQTVSGRNPFEMA